MQFLTSFAPDSALSASEEAADALRADLVVLRGYASSNAAIERALTIIATDFETVEHLEGRRATVPHDDVVMDAVREHGGIRAAARALGIGVATVSRIVTRCSTGTPTPVHRADAG